MLLRIGDTMIDIQYITHVFYNRDAVPANPEYHSGGQPQSIVIYFVSGESHTYTGATADELWEYLLANSNLKPLEE